MLNDLELRILIFIKNNPFCKKGALELHIIKRYDMRKWDAFNDCLTDLCQKGLILVHYRQKPNEQLGLVYRVYTVSLKGMWVLFLSTKDLTLYRHIQRKSIFRKIYDCIKLF